MGKKSTSILKYLKSNSNRLANVGSICWPTMKLTAQVVGCIGFVMYLDFCWAVYIYMCDVIPVVS